MEHLQTYFWPFIIAQIVSFLLLWTAYSAPRLARILFFLLFSWASYVNLSTSIRNPEAYLEYAPMAVSFYANFINGWFKDHITIMVSCIAFGQALIAFSILLKDEWLNLACIGGIAFLLAIAPLGIGAGFPFSITASLALYFILKKGKHSDYIWKTIKRKSFYES